MGTETLNGMQQASPTVEITPIVSPAMTPPGTPTIDPARTSLEVEKLQHETNWWWSNSATLLSTLLSTLAVLAVAYVSFHQWRADRRLSG